MQTARRSPESGFTLLELLVAMAVLAVVMVPLAMAFYSSIRTTQAAERDISQSTDAQRLISYFSRDVQNVDREGVNAFDGCGDASAGVHLVSLAWGLGGENPGEQATYVVTGFGRDSKLVRYHCFEGDQPEDAKETVVMSAFGEPGRDALDMVHGPRPEDAGAPFNPLEVCNATTCTIEVDGTYSFSHTATRRVPGTMDGVQYPPGAPPRPSANGRHLHATVTWEAPELTTGQPPILGFRVHLYAEEGTVPIRSVNLGPDDRYWRADGLPLETSYFFRVQAHNSVGMGALSLPSDVVTSQVSTPEPPQYVTVIEGDQRLDVSWQPPADDGGTPVTGYRITATHLASGGNEVVEVEGAGTLQSVVPNLINGDEYHVVVQALNARGQGLPSAALTVFTPYGAPAPPDDVEASGGDGQVYVQWPMDPEAGNGRPVVGYDVALFAGDPMPGSPVSTTSFTLAEAGCADEGAVPRFCTVTLTGGHGVVNAMYYRATVAPRVEISPGDIQAGDHSEPSEPVDRDPAKRPPFVRTSTAPGQVSTPAVSQPSPGTFQITVTLPPNGGEPIERLEIQSRRRSTDPTTWVGASEGWSSFAHNTYVEVEDGAGQQRTATVAGDPGYMYEFQVAAVNVPDWYPGTDRRGPWSGSSPSATVVGSPTEPLNVTLSNPVNSFGKALRVAWQAPLDNGGAPLSYTVACNASGSPTLPVVNAGPFPTAGAQTISHADIRDGRTYTCAVTATNSHGSSSANSGAHDPYGNCVLATPLTQHLRRGMSASSNRANFWVRGDQDPEWWQILLPNINGEAGLIQFDWSTHCVGQGRALPSTSVVTRAEFRANIEQTRGRRHRLERLTGSWNTSATWAGPSGSHVGDAWCANTAGWRTSGATDNLRDAVNSMRSGSQNYGFAVRDDGTTSSCGNAGVDTESVRYSGSASSNRPELVMRFYTDGAP